MEGRTYDLAAHLLDCACQRLADECPGRHCVAPGTEPSFENCCAGETGGQLTVNVIRRFPSRQFPTPDFGSPRNCFLPYVVTQYQLTIVRCAHVGSGRQGPTCTDLDTTAQQTMRDMERVWDGIACCLNDDDTVRQLVLGAYQWTFGNQETTEPQGGCVGSTTDVLVGIPPCVECP